ncbi:MAG: glycosyltransferase family 4 protein [Ferruginibacter sp.]|nr:glycosyltransferase family 4 protein [Ferruginibacter sp.]
MDKKKIIHIVPTFELGGVQTGILYSLEDLNKVFDYKVLVIGRVDAEWLKNLSPHLHVHIIRTGTNSLFFGALRAFKILKKLSPHIIISSLWKSVLIAASYKLFYPKVYLLGFFHNAFPYHFIGNCFLQIMVRFQNSALADSNETKTFLKERYNVEQTDVIPYNFSFEKPGLKRRAFDPSFIRLVFFGRLSQNKGIDRNLEFCRLCKEAGISFEYHLYGDIAEQENRESTYELMIRRLGIENEVTIKKVVPNDMVLEKMHEYDFLLHLSNMEGMALAVVEAMNCGLVPVVTPVGEIRHYSKDGENAIWLQPQVENNMHDLLGKLKNVVSHPTKYYQISAAAAQTFKHYKKYSEAMIEALDSKLRKI